MNLLLIGEKKSGWRKRPNRFNRHKTEASMPQFSENFCIINSHPHVAATWLAAHFRIPFYLARYFCEPELSAVLKLLGGSLEEAA